MKIVLESKHVGYTGGGVYTAQLAKAFFKIFGKIYIKGNIFTNTDFINTDLDSYEKYDGSFQPDLFIAISQLGGIKPIGKKNAHVCFYPLTPEIHSKYVDYYHTYDCAICLNEFVENEQKKYWNLKSYVVYPFVDINKFHIGVKKDIILNVGNYFYLTNEYNNSKNQHMVIDWFIKNELYKKYKLIMVGNMVTDDYYEQLCKMINKTKFDALNKQLILTNYNIELFYNIPAKDLVEYYSNAKYLIHAMGYGRKMEYATEHFGIVAIEAMASGCQPIVHNSGGCKDIDGTIAWNEFEDIIDLMGETNTTELREKSKKYSFENMLKQVQNFVDDFL